MSDTPRMQSALLDHPDAGFARIWQVGCDIERELTTAQDRIKRLEEAGDVMVSHAKALGMDGTGLVKRWFKAKEANP